MTKIIKDYSGWLNEVLNPGCGCGDTALTEATGFLVPGQGGSTPVVKLSYAAGYYSLKHTSKVTGKVYDNEAPLKRYLAEIKTFLEANPGQFITKVRVKASESIVPNYDTEGGSGKVDIGWLSEKRRQGIEAFIKAEIQPLFAAGKTKVEPSVRFEFVDAVTKKEPSKGWNDYIQWAKAGMDPANTEYTELKKGYDADQYTSVTLTVQKYVDPKCMLGLWIGIHYDELEIGHVCNHARFEISANGVILNTVAPPPFEKEPQYVLPAGKPYSSMNNAGGKMDDLEVATGRASGGGKRKNWFHITDQSQIDQIVSGSGGTQMIQIRAKCIVSEKGWKSGGGCHIDAPHVYVYNKDGQIMSRFPTYPKTNNGVIARTDFCGNNLDTQNLKTAKSNDGAVDTSTPPKETGVKLNFASERGSTLASDQVLSNYINTKTVVKRPDNTYIVMKDFNYNGFAYKRGDVINQVLKAGTVIQPPANRVAPAQ
jgi:hypothetical protein